MLALVVEHTDFSFLCIYVHVYVCLRTYICMCASGTLTRSTETEWYTSYSSKGCDVVQAHCCVDVLVVMGY